jgi:hypothetical protein
VAGTLYPSSCLRKTTSSGRPQSCRNSALFPDSAGIEDRRGYEVGKSQSLDEELKRRLSVKSVHFMDSDGEGSMKLYSDDEVDMERYLMGTNSGRPRSKSNPQTESTNVGFPGEVGDKNRGEYGIRLREDWVDTTTDPHSCKGYKIVQKSNTRLSSSTPDLSKLTVPFFIGPSSTAPC